MTVLKLAAWLVIATSVVLVGCAQQAELPRTPTAVPSAPGNAIVSSPTVLVATPIAVASPAPTVMPRPTLGPVEYQPPVEYHPSGRPVAVVVENEMAARPQSGLGQADVIYEAVAEWNLTRFVAVFSSNLAETVGPVRSGRAYHAAIAAEYGAVLAQCLGVPSQRAVLGATKVFGFDGCQMLDPPGFWRDNSRRAPHNLYVAPPILQKFAGGAGTPGIMGKRLGWGIAGDMVNQIGVVYPEDHEVRWQFDAARQQYLRWQDGERHVLMDGAQLGAAAVVVQFVAVQNSSYYGENGYHELTLTGDGKALIYAGKVKQAATWRRPSLDSSTHFFDDRGAEILFPLGPLFVQLVANGVTIYED